MTRKRIYACATAALGAVALTPALAPAAANAAITASGLVTCYSAVAPKGVSIPLTLSGGTPGDDFQVSATYPGKGTGSAGSVGGTFDATGAASVTIDGVYPAGDAIDPIPGGPVSLTVQDFDAAGDDPTTPIGSVTIGDKALSIADKPYDIRKPRVVSVSGVQFANQTLYAFLTNGSGSKVLSKFRIGTANACGYAKTKAVVAPPKFRDGEKFRFYVNAGNKLNKAKAVSQVGKVSAI